MIKVIRCLFSFFSRKSLCIYMFWMTSITTNCFVAMKASVTIQTFALKWFIDTMTMMTFRMCHTLVTMLSRKSPMTLANIRFRAESMNAFSTCSWNHLIFISTNYVIKPVLLTFVTVESFPSIITYAFKGLIVAMPIDTSRHWQALITELSMPKWKFLMNGHI